MGVAGAMIRAMSSKWNPQKPGRQLISPPKRKWQLTSSTQRIQVPGIVPCMLSSPAWCPDSGLSCRTTEQANEHFHVPQSSWNKSRGMSLSEVESSAEILLSPRSTSPRRDMTLSPRSALEKKTGKWDGSDAKLGQASKAHPVCWS